MHRTKLKQDTLPFQVLQRTHACDPTVSLSANAHQLALRLYRNELQFFGPELRQILLENVFGIR